MHCELCTGHLRSIKDTMNSLGKADTQSPGFAVSDWRAGLPFRDGLLRTLKVGDALNI